MRTDLPKKICILDLETEKTNFGTPERSRLAFVGIKVCAKRHKGGYYSGDHRCFLPNKIQKLQLFLKEFSGIIIGHNILQFDYRVLRPLISLDGIVEKTVDTLALLYVKRGNKFGGLGLDNLCRVNFGKGKTFDPKFVSLAWRLRKRAQVMRYNDNDCTLTKKLWWQLVRKQSLRIEYYNKSKKLPISEFVTLSMEDVARLTGKRPLFTFRAWEEKIEKDAYILEKRERKYYLDDAMVAMVDMSSHIPFQKCPQCGSVTWKKVDRLKEVLEKMSEGELAEYMAGNWGTICCKKCGHSIRYDISGAPLSFKIPLVLKR